MKFIPYAKPSLINKDKKHLIKAFDSTWISGGFYVDSFEKNFAKFLNCNKTLSVNNGTSAIDLVYQSLDLKPGDEIIFPKINPNLNQSLFKGVRNFEFNKPKNRKIREIIRDHNLGS